MSTNRNKSNMPSVVTKPLHIDFVITPYLGKLAMSACPGLSFGKNTYRSTLEDDVSTIHRLGILTVISLMETQELKRVGAKSISHYLGRRNIAWHQLQVSQSGTPNISTIHQWRRMAKPLINTLATGGNVLIHCLEGKGRTGVMTACLLKILGMSGETAIAHVRRARQGVFQTALQEEYVLSFRPQIPIG